MTCRKAPAPGLLNVTVPDGFDFVPGAVSSTTALQVEAWFSATVAGVQVTVVAVERRPRLNVTVNAPSPPKTSEQGLVVPIHVLLDALAGALHPPNDELPPAVARNVIVAPLSDIVMFGEQVLVTVWEVTPVPVPPHETGALTVPVLGVIFTVPVPAPAKVRTQLRAAVTYGPTNGPPPPTGAAPRGLDRVVRGVRDARGEVEAAVAGLAGVPAGSALRARRDDDDAVRGAATTP